MGWKGARRLLTQNGDRVSKPHPESDFKSAFVKRCEATVHEYYQVQHGSKLPNGSHLLTDSNSGHEMCQQLDWVAARIAGSVGDKVTSWPNFCLSDTSLHTSSMTLYPVTFPPKINRTIGPRGCATAAPETRKQEDNSGMQNPNQQVAWNFLFTSTIPQHACDSALTHTQDGEI